MKTFSIVYVVDTGYDYIKDVALVKAEDERGAVNILKECIHKKGADYGVHRVIEVNETDVVVFTQLYGNMKEVV